MPGSIIYLLAFCQIAIILSMLDCELWERSCSQDVSVSLIILARGVPRSPYDTTKAMVLHLPGAEMPVQASASLSRARILVPLMPELWCPHVAEEKAEPEKSFLDFLDILAR